MGECYIRNIVSYFDINIALGTQSTTNKESTQSTGTKHGEYLVTI